MQAINFKIYKEILVKRYVAKKMTSYISLKMNVSPRIVILTKSAKLMDYIKCLIEIVYIIK